MMKNSLSFCTPQSATAVSGISIQGLGPLSAAPAKLAFPHVYLAALGADKGLRGLGCLRAGRFACGLHRHNGGVPPRLVLQFLQLPLELLNLLPAQTLLLQLLLLFLLLLFSPCCR